MKDNKLVLISGSGRGLGASIAESFANRGYKVAINYCKSEKQAHELADKLGPKVIPFYADVSIKEDVVELNKNICDTFKKGPDILVNNAMTEYLFNGDLRKKANEITWDEIQNHLDVTIK
jgi:3-oxoacyl-[acyl-carrier protein] reductase